MLAAHAAIRCNGCTAAVESRKAAQVRSLGRDLSPVALAKEEPQEVSVSRTAL
jgi:hypothetical protein